MNKHTKEQGDSASCTFCTNPIRLQTFENLKPGDHIRIGGKHLMFNIFNCQVSFYSHHAIVKHVEILSPSSANVTVISFQSSSFNKSLNIRETTQCFNLTYEEVNVIQYTCEVGTSEIIQERAQALLTENEKYSIFYNNCEHFANYCCTGIAQSNQIYDITDWLEGIAMGPFQKLIRIVLKYLGLTAKIVKDIPGKSIILGPGKAILLEAVIYFIYNLHRQYEIERNVKEGKMCQNCCQKRQTEMWFMYKALCGAQTGGDIILDFLHRNGCSGGTQLGISRLLMIANTMLVWVLPKLKEKLLSPNKCKRERIAFFRNLSIGDVIAFKMSGMLCDSIVSKIDIIPSSNRKKAVLNIVHYALPRSFGQRQIMEEEILIDLKKTDVFRYDFSGVRVYPPALVLNRAWKRLGEAKYSFISNRSCHFCYWAKVAEDDTAEETFGGTIPNQLFDFCRSLNPGETVSPYRHIEIDHRAGKPSSSSAAEEMEVRVREEVKKGQIVRMKVEGRKHHGIVTDVDYSSHYPSVFVMSVVHRGMDNKLTENVVQVDLNTENVWLYKYHPVYRFTPKEIVVRARQRVGKRKCGMIEQSFKLVQEIAQKALDRQIERVDVLAPGDIVVFRYWGVKSTAVVSASVSLCTNDTAVYAMNDGKVGNVPIIHYAWTGYFTYTIKEENFKMDLNTDSVELKNYDGFATHQGNEVVRRARERIGESAYSLLGNSSLEFVHWAKVIQKPSVVRIGNAEECLLLPDTGQQYGYFQRLPVHQWKDLKVGLIVEFYSVYPIIKTQAILAGADEESSTIDIIGYKNNGFCDYVMEETVPLNIRQDQVWVYICNPDMTNKADVVIQKAKQQLQERKFFLRRGCWQFCKACVLKDGIT